jgi:hypothetical protein
MDKKRMASWTVTFVPVNKLPALQHLIHCLN